jgi:hypothetical protein
MLDKPARFDAREAIDLATSIDQRCRAVAHDPSKDVQSRRS